MQESVNRQRKLKYYTHISWNGLTFTGEGLIRRGDTMSKVVSIINLKGGVGKTTLTLA